MKNLIPEPNGSMAPLEIEYFSTNPSVQEVLIMGEFNKWSLEFMVNDVDYMADTNDLKRFYFVCNVPVGYKYRY